MFLFYVDESGDTGRLRGSTPYFALSGIVLHELSWQPTIDQVIEFRKQLRARYGLKLREEIHAAHFIHKPTKRPAIPKSILFQILREAIDFQASLGVITVVNVVVSKAGKPVGYDVFENAWRALVQRFHNTIVNRNFPGPANPSDLGMLIVDRTDEKKLRQLTRRMRVYNPIPKKYQTPGLSYRQLPLTNLAEDPVHRDSKHSYFTQLADVNAYFLYQSLNPCRYVKRKGGRGYFARLDPVLCKVCAPKDPLGVVRL